MSAQTKYNVRDSFFANLVCNLIGSTTDLSQYPSILASTTDPDGKLIVEHNSENFIIAPKLLGEDFELPGINVVFLGDDDRSPERLRTKRRVMPIVLEVMRPLDAGEPPFGVMKFMMELTDRIDEIMRVGGCEIWQNLSIAYQDSDDPGPAQPAPSYTGRQCWWIGEALTWEDESKPQEGGFIRLMMDVFVTYTE